MHTTRITSICLACLALTAIAPALHAGGNWTATGTADWSDPNNWNDSALPSPTQPEGINITNGGTAVLSETFNFTANTGPVISIGDRGGLASALKITGDGRLVSSDAGIFLGRGSAADGSTGAIYLDGNASLKASNLSLGRSADSVGILSLAARASVIIDTDLILGFQANASGTLALSGQSSLTARDLILGNNGTGTITTAGVVTLADQSLLTARRVNVGKGGTAPSSLIMTGGTLRTTGTGSELSSRVGDAAGSSGTVALSGNAVWHDMGSSEIGNQTFIGNSGYGILTLQDNAAYINDNSGAYAFTLGSASGTGVLVIRDNAIISSTHAANTTGQSGGININRGSLLMEGNATVDIARLAIGTGNASTTGTLTLNGGMLSTNYIELSRSLGSATIIASGGTLRATYGDGYGNTSATGINWIRSKAVANATILLTGSGLAIDSNGHTVSSDVPFTGGGNFTKLGEGLFHLPASAHTGTTTVAGGTLRLAATDAIAASAAVNIAAGATLDAFAKAQKLKNLSGAGTLANASAITIESTADSTYAGTFTDVTSLVKTGAARLTLDGSNGLDSLAVNQGHLTLSGGTLALADDFTLAATATLGIGGAAKITAAAATLADGSIIDVVSNPGEGTFNIIESAAAISANAGNITLLDNGVATGGAISTAVYSAYALQFADSSKTLQLVTNLLWNSTGTAHGTFNIAAASSATVSSPLDDRDSSDFTALAGWDGKSLAKTGAGTLVLTATNTYTGSTAVTDGTLRLAAANAIAASDAVRVAAGATLVADGPQTLKNLASAGAVSLNAESTLGVTGTLALDDNSTLDFVVGSGTGPVVTGGHVTVGAGVTLNLAGISDSTEIPFSLIAATTGTIAGDFTGITIGGVGGSTDYFTIATQKTADAKAYLLSAALTWNQTGIGRHGTFTLEGGSSFTVNEALSNKNDNPDTGWDGLSLTKKGTGTLTLAGNNTYTGTTTIEAGVLQIGNGGATGSIAGEIANSATLAFNRSDAATHAGLISGAGVLIQQGGGTLTLTADNTHTGATIINDGMVRLGDGGATGSVAGEIVNRAALAFDRSDAYTHTGLISGDGALIQQGGGTLTLTADSARTGATIISNGKLLVANVAALGTGAIENDATLEIAAASDAGLANALSGTGALVKTGAGALTLGGANDGFSGVAQIEAGRLTATTASALGSAGVSVNAGATLDYQGIAGGVVGSSIAGAGTLLFTSSTLSIEKSSAVGEVALHHSLVTFAHATGTVSLGHVRLDNATLGFARPAGAFVPRAATLASLSGADSLLTLNVDFSRAVAGLNPGGAAGDYLVITGSLSGSHKLAVNPGATRPSAYGVSIELLSTVADRAAADAFTLDAPVPIGMDAFDLKQGDGSDMLPNERSWYLADAGASSTANAIFNIGAMPGLDWNHTLDSLHLRLGDLRSLETESAAAAPPSAGLWMRFRSSKLDAPDIPGGLGFKQQSNGLSFGADRMFSRDKASYVLGVLVERSWLDCDFNDGTQGDSSSASLGVYAGWLHNTGWFADLIGRIGRYKNTLNVDGKPGGITDASFYSTDAQGISLELGRRFALGGDWWLEAALQGALAHFDGDDYNVRIAGTEYPVSVDSSTTTQYRAQLRAGRRFLGANLYPYAKFAVANVDSTGGEIRAGTRAGHVDFDGARVEAGAGLTWRLTPRSHVYADYEYASADSYDRPWSINLGYRHAW
ncbi:MAG: autotransporter outer membrane beta-barrel domain-containing protein [Opitutaceae bacterium]|jgi:outer membrane autotransporter protein|nr:autotransporter outer membrane beta-barrel domain-containing protein [Opitutaceae bacterium]